MTKEEVKKMWFDENGYCRTALEKYNYKDTCQKDYCVCIVEANKLRLKKDRENRRKFYFKCTKLFENSICKDHNCIISHSKATLYPTRKKVRSKLSGKIVYYNNRKDYYNFCKRLITKFGIK